MAHSKKFQHGDRSLEVRAEPTSTGWDVRVYEANKAATEVTYAIEHETEIDGLPNALLERLMNLAQSDVVMGIVRLLP